MIRRFLPLAALLLFSIPVFAQSPVGDWEGGLAIPGQPEPLKMILRVADAGDSLAITLDVPQQGGIGIPATGVRSTTDSLMVEYSMFGGRFALAVAADSLYGTFSQGPGTLPIVLKAGQPLQRPQTPEGPFPYATEEVTVESEPGVTLAGTFVKPEGDGPFPTVVFLTGSGAQDRDETIAEHRPFAVIADALARAGVASLRADDRGAGESTGDFSASTLETHLTDAQALLATVRQRDDVASVGVIGHSEGGVTALRLAGDLDFVVTLAGPTLTFAEVYPEQLRRAVRLSGIDSTAADMYRQAVDAALVPLTEAPDAPDDVLRPLMDSAFNEGLVDIPMRDRQQMGLAGPAYQQVKTQFLDFLLTPGMRSLISYNPAENIAALNVPTLALYGGKDFQVPAEMNASALRAATQGKPVTVTVIADANHLFQTADTGSGAEYGQIEETIAPETLEMIVAWIAEIGGV
ncbi:MAG: alpha/beta hydrolase [Rubricoccaceae bacterium]